MLNPGGQIIILGLAIALKRELELARIARLEQDFIEKYQISIHIHPNKGYLDKKDLKEIKSVGFSVRLQPGLRLKSLTANLGGGRYQYYYATYRKN